MKQQKFNKSKPEEQEEEEEEVADEEKEEEEEDAHQEEEEEGHNCCEALQSQSCAALRTKTKLDSLRPVRASTP